MVALSNKSSALLRQAQHKLFLGTSFQRRDEFLPPLKGGGSKAELVELFETGDLVIEKLV